MEIEVGGTDALAVVAVRGRVDAYTAPDVEEKLQEQVAAGKHLVVDLSATDYVSSAGLRVLITLAKRALGGQFAMRLCGMQDAVREVFDIAGFTKLFEIRESAAAAVAELTA
ncbi:MAG: STAS domain-containing protein [Fimbriimonadaceae bacterium]|nr:STAS domain-containing protein [Fimbriimonadaceae bacterium]